MIARPAGRAKARSRSGAPRIIASAMTVAVVMTNVKTDWNIVSVASFSLMSAVPKPKSASATGRLTQMRMSAMMPISAGVSQSGSRHIVTKRSAMDMARRPRLVTRPWSMVLSMFMGERRSLNLPIGKM